MDKKKFEKLMDSWAAQEMEAAPDLEPSPEVYRKLEEKKERSRFSLFSWPVRLAAAGIAAALIVLVVVLQPPKDVEPLLGLRKGTAPEKTGRQVTPDKMQVLDEEKGKAEEEVSEDQAGGEERAEKQKKIGQIAKEREKKEGAERMKKEEPSAKIKIARKIPETAETKESEEKNIVSPKEAEPRPRMEIKPIAVAAAPSAAVTERIEFQYQPGGSGPLQVLDMKASMDEAVSLSSEDNYRLMLQFLQDRYVYVFQVIDGTQAVRLFPNVEFSPSQNPFRSGERIIIPTPPDWFYAEKDAGEVAIYVITSRGPLQGWGEPQGAEELLGTIEKQKQSPGSQVSVRVFKFAIR